MSWFTQLAEWLSPRAKAIVAGAGSVTILTLRLSNDADGMTAADWQTVIESGLALAGIVYAVPNVPRKPPTK